MTPFNMFLVLVAIVAAALGFRKGLIKQLGAIAGIIAGIIACRMFGPTVTDWCRAVATEGTSDILLTMIAYVGVFLLAYLIVSMSATLMQTAAKVVHIALLDRIGGAVFKMVLWLFILSLGVNAWCAFFPEHLPEGKIANFVTSLAPMVIGATK